MKRLIPLILLFLAAPSFAATCKISEYSDLVRDANNQWVPVANEPAVTTQNITYTTSTASAAFNASTKFIRIVCDAKAHFVVGTAPTAAATDPFLPANTPEYFGIGFGATGGLYKIAFYDGSS